jgi:uncharacterized protein (DUF885 family)
MRSRSILLFLILILPLAALGAGSQTAQKPSDLQARRDVLNRLLAEEWEHSLSTNPEFASLLGDKRWNDQLSDVSDKAREADLAKSKDFLRRFEAIDTTGFPEQEALNKELMVLNLSRGIEGYRFKGWLMPVTQISGGVRAQGAHRGGALVAAGR